MRPHILRREINLVSKSSLESAMEGQNIFFPVHLAFFTAISREMRKLSSTFIRMSVTRILSLVTGSNLVNRWPQRDIRFPLKMWKPTKVAQAVTNAKKNRKKKRGRSTIYDPKPSKKLLVQLWVENHEWLETLESTEKK